MKKILVLTFLSIFLLTGCKGNKVNEQDYSKYSFTNVNWLRDSGNDIETIKFKSNGEFSYYCACGNPVNDSDMCETYTYDENKKELKLNCFETTEETITEIKLISYNEEFLELDFNGEVRKFIKE